MKKTTTTEVKNPLGVPQALLPLSVIEGIVGLGKSAIYSRVARGAFPEPVRLSVKCSRWRAGDIAAWLEAQGAGK